MPEIQHNRQQRMVDQSRGQMLKWEEATKEEWEVEGQTSHLQSVCLLIAPMAQLVWTTAGQWRTLRLRTGSATAAHFLPSLYHFRRGNIKERLYLWLHFYVAEWTDMGWPWDTAAISFFESYLPSFRHICTRLQLKDSISIPHIMEMTKGNNMFLKGGVSSIRLLLFVNTTFNMGPSSRLNTPEVS